LRLFEWLEWMWRRREIDHKRLIQTQTLKLVVMGKKNNTHTEVVVNGSISIFIHKEELGNIANHGGD